MIKITQILSQLTLNRGPKILFSLVILLYISLFLIISYADSNEIANFELTLQDNEGNNVEAEAVLYNDDYTNEKHIDINEQVRIKKELYNANISLEESQIINNIEIFKLNVTNQAIIKIDEVPISEVTKPSLGQWEKVYAIDPTNASFEKATLSIIATGSKLYKCKEWDFERRICNGYWKELQQIMP